MPTYSTTTKRALRWLTGANPISDIDAGFQALAEDVEATFGTVTAIPGVETTTSGSYVLLATADQVAGLLVPANGLIKLNYRALWKSTAGTASVAIFVGSNQLKKLAPNGAPAIAQHIMAIGDNYSPLFSHSPAGLITDESDTADSSLVTTGFIAGSTPAENEISIDGLPAGTYSVSVRFAASGGGTVSVKERVLRARVAY